MFTMPRISSKQIKQAQQLVKSDLLGFDSFEKVAIGKVGLMLNQAQSLNMDSLTKAIKDLDRNQINTAFSNALENWSESLTQQSNSIMAAPLDIELTYRKHDERYILAGRISAYGYAYDLQKLSRLSNKDADVVALAIAEIRNVLLCVPLPTDLEDYAGWEQEKMDAFTDWLPKNLKNANHDRLLAYWEKHGEDFQDEYEADDYIIDAYIDRRAPFPKWYKTLNDGVGRTDISGAISSLSKKLPKVVHPEAKQFVQDVIESLTQFSHHFNSQSEWERFRSAVYESDPDLRQDDPEIELGFMLTWGEEGYWWDCVSGVGNDMQNAGETPAYYAELSTEQDQADFILFAEQVYRASALFQKMNMICSEEKSSYSNMPYAMVA